MRLRVLVVICLLAVITGCGGGGGSTATVDTQLFTPNYISSLNVLLHWNHLPMRVAFNVPSNAATFGWSPNIYADAANEWNQPGKQPLTTVVPYGNPADVVVQFVDRSNFSGGSNATGLTNVTYNPRSLQISTASIEITPQSPFGGYLSNNDAQVTIAHEIGHALGIQGHSPNPGDLMYSTFHMGTFYSPTTEDFNTIMSAYPNYFTPGLSVLQSQEYESPNEPLVTVRIE